MYIWEDWTKRCLVRLAAPVVGILPPRYHGDSWRLELIVGHVPIPVAWVVYWWAVWHNARHRRWYGVRIGQGYCLPGSLPLAWRRRLHGWGEGVDWLLMRAEWLVLRGRKRLRGLLLQARDRARRAWRRFVYRLGSGMVPADRAPKPARRRSWNVWKRW